MTLLIWQMIKYFKVFLCVCRDHWSLETTPTQPSITLSSCTTHTQTKCPKSALLPLHARVYFNPFPPTSLSGNGILMMSVDNLPAQFPRESTEFFGSKLLPLLHDFVSGACDCTVSGYLLLLLGLQLKVDGRKPLMECEISNATKNVRIWGHLMHQDTLIPVHTRPSTLIRTPR